ncbi:MAG: hypothetical protein JNK06_15950 [Candidatus Accumulibacter phosphatis]|nr:hypothetical protein [Candidatus Accumulibacter phosphatis]
MRRQRGVVQQLAPGGELRFDALRAFGKQRARPDGVVFEVPAQVVGFDDAERRAVEEQRDDREVLGAAALPLHGQRVLQFCKWRSVRRIPARRLRLLPRGLPEAVTRDQEMPGLTIIAPKPHFGRTGRQRQEVVSPPAAVRTSWPVGVIGSC